MKPNVDALAHLEIPPALPVIFQINERTIPVTFFSPFPSFTFGKSLGEFNQPVCS
jgi:hypothetical protein